MREPTRLDERIWWPYFRPISGEHDSGYGLFEVGYIDGNRSRVILCRNTDAITIEPPVRGRLALDHHANTNEVQIAGSDTHGLFPWWGDVSGAGAELVWRTAPARFGFAIAPRAPSVVFDSETEEHPQPAEESKS